MDKNQISNKEKFLSFKEAKEFLGVSAIFLYKLTSGKKIRHFKPTNGRIWFKESDLEDWIKSGEIKKVKN